MTRFAETLTDRVEGYIALRRSLGYAFCKQAATLRALAGYVASEERLDGPLTQVMVLNFVVSWNGSANGRAIRYGVVRRFTDRSHVGLPQRIARLSGASDGAGAAGRAAGEHGLAFGRGAPP